MSYILMFYYNPLNPPFLRGTWSKIISLNSYTKSAFCRKITLQIGPFPFNGKFAIDKFKRIAKDGYLRIIYRFPGKSFMGKRYRHPCHCDMHMGENPCLFQHICGGCKDVALTHHISRTKAIHGNGMSIYSEKRMPVLVAGIVLHIDRFAQKIIVDMRYPSLVERRDLCFIVNSTYTSRCIPVKTEINSFVRRAANTCIRPPFMMIIKQHAWVKNPFPKPWPVKIILFCNKLMESRFFNSHNAVWKMACWRSNRGLLY